MSYQQATYVKLKDLTPKLSLFLMHICHTVCVLTQVVWEIHVHVWSQYITYAWHKVKSEYLTLYSMLFNGDTDHRHM